MSEVANIWRVGQTDVTPTSALLRSPTVMILFLGMWGVNVAILDKYGLAWRRAFGFEGNGVGVGGGGGGGGLEMSAIKANNAANKSRALDHANSALEALSQAENGGGEGENDKGPLFSSPTTSSSPADSDTSTSSYSSITADITLVSVSLLVLLYLTQFTWITIFSGGILGASIMFYAYTIAFILYSSPTTLSGRTRSKIFILLSILWEIVTGARGFVHVFVADALCSLSKVFFDQGLLLILAFHYPDHIASSSRSLIIPSLFASTPYLIRARQCTNSWIHFTNKSDPMRHMHVLNGIKYFSSIVPIMLITLQQLESNEAKKIDPEYKAILALVVNTVYTFCWDVFVDWGLGAGLFTGFNFCEVGPGGGAPSTKKVKKGRDGCLRQGIRFGNNATILAISVNLFLRCSWMLRFSNLSLTEDQFIFLSQFLEVFRRSLWNLFRIEWQLETIERNNSADRIR